MRIRVSRRTLRWIGVALGVMVALTGLYGLGERLTPRDAAGRPLIYSPSVRAAERYRRHARRWSDELEALDERLVALLSQSELTDPARLYALSREAEELVGETTRIAQAASFTPAPPALVGVKALVQEVTQAYVEAARAAAVWVGTPKEDQWDQAHARLEMARDLREELESSRWLQQEGNGRDDVGR